MGAMPSTKQMLLTMTTIIITTSVITTRATKSAGAAFVFRGGRASRASLLFQLSHPLLSPLPRQRNQSILFSSCTPSPSPPPPSSSFFRVSHDERTRHRRRRRRPQLHCDISSATARATSLDRDYVEGGNSSSASDETRTKETVVTAAVIRNPEVDDEDDKDEVRDGRAGQGAGSHNNNQTPRRERRNNKSRFRQHVNPLASKYQEPAVLSKDWPRDVFDDCAKPLHLDIGCGKGGYLLEAARKEKTEEVSDLADTTAEYNYLGLEIRLGVAEYAKDRIKVHGLQGKLDFVACNANVDLERVLTRYQEASPPSSTHPTQQHVMKLHRVSIQFPDPHFKSHHAKRRVVTQDLVSVLARFLQSSPMMPLGQVFLQSDVQSVLDDMRQQFRLQKEYFEDRCSSSDEYLSNNVWGTPTERERSVLAKVSAVQEQLDVR